MPPRPIEVTDPRFDDLSAKVEELSASVSVQVERLTTLGEATEELLAAQTTQREQLDLIASQLADLSVLQAAQSASLAELGGRITALDVRLKALEPPPETEPDPVDCVLGDWAFQSASEWGPCTPDGTHGRTEVWARPILTEPAHGGAACGPTTETRSVVQRCTYVPPPPPPPPPTGDHGYFDLLRGLPSHWLSYSLRGDVPLSPWVTYSPSTDTDPQRQDAAKVVIPAFEPRTVLKQSLDASATTLVLVECLKTAFKAGRVVRVDNEWMTVTAWTDLNTCQVTRGMYGTTPAEHAAGAKADTSTNSLPAQVRVPLFTEDGYRYLFTWDSLHTDSYIGSGLSNHKAFQFGDEGIWLEPQTRFNGNRVPGFDPATHIYSAGFRSYNKLTNPDPDWSLTDGNQLGPGVGAQALPQVGYFNARPGVWVRWWVLLDQLANDYDYVSAWAGDKDTGPIQILNSLPISVRTVGKYPHSIENFWLEFNTSTDTFLRTDGRDLVAYVKNIVASREPLTALRDLADVTPLLLLS